MSFQQPTPIKEQWFVYIHDSPTLVSVPINILFILSSIPSRRSSIVIVYLKLSGKTRMLEKVDHPYVPRDLKLPGYVPGFLSQSTILAVYGSSSLLVISFMWILSGRFRKISKVDRLLMCWWIFTGLTHMILEGYFAFSPDFYKENTPHYLAEVWKEYSKGDSRYAGRDSGVVAVEGITAVLEGPACLLAVYAIATKKPYNYILQIAISLGQLYGTAVYFVTAILEGDNFAASAFYYYAYYIMANVWWVIIPSTIVVHCWKKICAAFQVQEQKMTKTS